MFVSVFKTAAHSKEDKLSIFQILKNLGVKFIATLDLTDEDRVLRVESKKNISESVVKELNSNQYYCEELDTFLYGSPVKR